MALDIYNPFGFLMGAVRSLGNALVPATTANVKAATTGATYTVPTTTRLLIRGEIVLFRKGDTLILTSDEVAALTAAGVTPTSV